ncbi:MAG TPA: VOC family protein [Myxococcota bacterium]|nr:VOC family protein [Myxococcota bacterium]
MAGSRVISCLRYHDAPAAVDWLCRAFGFEKHAVHVAPNGGIAHAELTLGDGMIMLGSAVKQGGRYDEIAATPREVGGRSTQQIYVVVADPELHFRCATSAGAEIVFPLEPKRHGGSGYTCRDPEGNLWSFGSYDPWLAAE